MITQYDPSTKSPESTADWLRNFREAPQLPLIIKRFYPQGIDQERLMDRAGDYVLSYAAWETVRLGRASLAVGNPYTPDVQGRQLPYTGFEGYLAGSDIPNVDRIRFIAQSGSHFDRVGRIVFGDARMKHIEEFLSGDMQTINKFSDETLKSIVISADTLFNWIRQYFKDDIARVEEEFMDFRSATYESLKMMPESYYSIDPMTHKVSLSIPLPRQELVRHGIPYDVVLKDRENQGYSFMVIISHAASPVLAATVQDMLDPLEHTVEAYY